MSAQNENTLGLASAVRDLTDDEFLQAVEYGRSLGLSRMLGDAQAAVAAVAREDAAAQRLPEPVMHA
jgi:hypothetical protein